MAEVRTLTRVVQTCAGHPSQWDAWTADGQYLYLRYRHGEGSVEWHSGPGDDADTPESWEEGRSGVLTEWDDGTGRGVIELEDFSRRRAWRWRRMPRCVPTVRRWTPDRPGHRSREECPGTTDMRMDTGK